MNTIYEQQGSTYQKQGNYFIPCVAVREQKELPLGMWANRHRWYFRQYYRVRYFNLLTSETLYEYLADVEEQTENYFQQLVKSFEEQENVAEKLKADDMVQWICMMNNIRNRALEIVNQEVIFV